MRTTHLDNEINRLKWLKRKGDLSPIGENALIEYEEIKEALNTSNISNCTSLKSSGDFRDDDNRESQSEYFGRK